MSNVEPANDPYDLLTQQAMQNDQRGLVGFESAPEPGDHPEPVADPVNKNLAMQLAIQNNPGADFDTLKIKSDEFYSYLTQQS